MKLTTGDRVTWHSAAGHLEGCVQRIDLDLNAAGDTIPWIVVDNVSNLVDGCRHSNVRLAGTNSNFAQLKFAVEN